MDSREAYSSKFHHTDETLQMLWKFHTSRFIYQLMLTKNLALTVSLKIFLGALKDKSFSEPEIWGNEGNLGTSPKITKIRTKKYRFCSYYEQHAVTSRSLTRPRYVHGTSRLHFGILQKILKRFKKKLMTKYWKFLSENRFWDLIEKFRNFWKITIFRFFRFFDFSKKINGNPTFFDFSIFSKNSDFPFFRKFFMKILIFENFRNHHFWNRFSIKKK